MYELEEVDEWTVREQERQRIERERRQHEAEQLRLQEITERLLEAVEVRDAGQCLQYIEDGADPNAVGKLGLAVLVLAVQQSLPDVCQALLRKGARAQLDDDNGTSLLALAVLRGLPAVAAAVANRPETCYAVQVGPNAGLDADAAVRLAEYCGATHTLEIGMGNPIGPRGLEALVQRGLRCLSVGAHTGVGDAGVRAIAKHCPGLEALSLGASNDVGAEAVAAVARACPGLLTVVVGDGNSVGEGMRHFPEHCPGLHELRVGDGNGLGPDGAAAVASKGRALTTLAIGAGNAIGYKGAEAIALNCPRLTTLDIGLRNELGERGALAFADNCINLTSIRVGGWQLKVPGGRTTVMRHCEALKDLRVADTRVEPDDLRLMTALCQASPCPPPEVGWAGTLPLPSPNVPSSVLFDPQSARRVDAQFQLIRVHRRPLSLQWHTDAMRMLLKRLRNSGSCCHLPFGH